MSLRRFLLCPPAVAVLLGLSGCSSVVVADQVVTKELIIVGADDKPRVFLGATEAANGILLYDSKGKIRAGLNYMLADDTSELVLGDAEGKVRVVLSHKSDTSVIVLRDAKGQLRARTRVGPEGALVELFDAEGNVVAKQP